MVKMINDKNEEDEDTVDDNYDVDYDDGDTGKDDADHDHDYDHREPRTSRSHVTTCRQVWGSSLYGETTL